MAAIYVEPIYASIGRNIKRARERKGWTQEMLASACEPPLTRAAMANMEAGRQRIMLHVLMDVAASCGTTIGRMLRPGPLPKTGRAA